jgi:hypothetical protein
VNPSGQALAGRLCLMPGRPLPTVQGARPVAAAARLARGRPAHELPGLLAALFTLCAQAHRLTARHAVQAACGENVAPTPADRLLLQEATARRAGGHLAGPTPAGLPAVAPRPGAGRPHGGPARLAGPSLAGPAAAPLAAAARARAGHLGPPVV